MSKALTIGLVILAVFILGGLGLFLFFNTGQNLTIPEVPIQTQTANLNGNIVNLESVYFGSISNQGKVATQTIAHGFCGGNDGDVTITNLVDDSNNLKLSSSLSGTKRPCTENYIDGKLTLPSGKLTISCDASAEETNDGVSTSSCSIKSGLNTLYSESSRWHVECGLSTAHPDWKLANCISVLDTQEIILDEETELDLRVESNIGNTGSASAVMILSFEPKIKEDITLIVITDEELESINNQLEVINPDLTNEEKAEVISENTGISEDKALIVIEEEIKEKSNLLIWFIVGIAILIFLGLVIWLIRLRK